jgi:acetyl-CoA carboxylase alpha subunit
VNARASVEDAKIKRELKEIELEMEKLDVQLSQLRESKVAKPRQTSEEDRLRGVFHRAETIATLNRIQKEELARHSDDLETQDIITRIADDERQRILEGRK